ncbi:uncharacterized protein F5147DRAFT_745699 [Suillus discolor]|uniref:CxC2-like cysteine cluster KDZ transposase-associated domain-containing protein n=1 Tax=Suillus discolor TaxID=1912936 RepID=A0A9P7F8J2_9AGAM|nr:uncharacterized protein F5147DRAFT_745699 [Suillus discolor]KAG2108722.1 hypothetical protein F5147DRAFT_745699 [Suillus discolor]
MTVRECFGMEMHCKDCLLEYHHHLPLHIMEMWNSSFFEQVSLKTLGLRIQLGHNLRDRYLNPRPSSGDDFVVIDVNGIHEVALDFCECPTAQIRYKQLLQAHWYPETTTNPCTTATFGVLEHYHLLSFESKVSAYEFYHSLAWCSNNTGLIPIRDRYAPFMCMIHEWRHLRQLRRAGRGHDPSGINATQKGELAVLCPACPQPGRNLPEGWENAGPDSRWCYALFIAMDANFQLKRKAVSSDQVDPGLNAGWAYFVEERQYKSHLNDCMIQRQEHSSCVSHNAINMADTKSLHGLAATGVGTCLNDVGDLQKGERYINMDYLVLSTLASSSVPVLNTMPTHLHLPHENLDIHYFVPKFHIGAHIKECQIAFSWNFGKFVGRTDGEAPEQGWANINQVASSTKEMGPGTQRDTLDNYFGDWNWKKITVLGRTLKHKMVDAVKWKSKHCRALDKLKATIHPCLVVQWKGEFETWEEDNTKPNPFQTITLAAVCLQLADLEASKLQVGINHSLHCNISPSILISTGLDLEEQQQCLRCDTANLSLHPTDKQKETLTHHTNTLQRKIDTWARVQELYMPIVPTLCSSATNPAAQDALKPQDFPLYLPSALDNALECDQQLCEYEWEMHYAQALDALNEVRSHLHLRSHMYKFKEKNLRGQAASTRAQALIAHVEARKDASVSKYRRACAALIALNRKLEKVGWEFTIRPLQNEDIRPMGDFAGGHSQGTGMLSWIWVAHRADNSCTENDRVQDCVHIEWCKARACASCWSEEVKLLLEEMRRAWQCRATLHQLMKRQEQEGLAAYTFCQAGLHADMRLSFQGMWNDVPILVASTLDAVDDTISKGNDETDEAPSLHAPPSTHNC